MSSMVAGEAWQTLRFAPLWVLRAVAGRDRRFHPAEVDAFWRSVREAALSANGLTADVLASVASDRETLVSQFEGDGRPIVSGLRAVVAALSTVSDEDSAQFRGALVLRVAYGVARARGPFGQTVSREDAETLSLVAALLDIDTSDPSEELAYL
jgi:hypothetical protein